VKAAMIAATILITAGCGYDGGYRYPCQNPDNWELEDCKPPKCTVWGTCPDDLVPSCGAMMGTDCKGV